MGLCDIGLRLTIGRSLLKNFDISLHLIPVNPARVISVLIIWIKKRDLVLTQVLKVFTGKSTPWKKMRKYVFVRIL